MGHNLDLAGSGVNRKQLLNKIIKMVNSADRNGASAVCQGLELWGRKHPASVGFVSEVNLSFKVNKVGMYSQNSELCLILHLNLITKNCLYYYT